MIQTRAHLNDNLERLQAPTHPLEHLDGQLADLGRGIVDLREEEADLPLLSAGGGRRIGRGGEELGEVLGREDADVLRDEGSASQLTSEIGKYRLRANLVGRSEGFGEEDSRMAVPASTRK